MLSGSVSAAADRLHTSQPSVSRTLKELEAFVGFNLFRRHRRGMDPTKEGRQFFEALERAYFGLAELEQTAHNIRELALGHVHIGSLPAMAFQLIPDVIAGIYKELGNVGLTYRVRDSQRLVEQIRMGQLDLALIAQPTFTSDLSVLGSWSFNNVCLLPKDHPLCASNKPVDLTKLGGTKIITFEDQYLTGVSLDRESFSSISVSTSFAGAVLIERGLGIAVIDPFTATYFAKAGNVVVREIKQKFLYEIVLLAPKTLGGRLADHFANQIIDTLNGL